MSVLFRLRQGIGLDVEYNEDICHIIVDKDGKEDFVAFAGALLKLPFVTIYIGDFFELD